MCFLILFFSSHVVIADEYDAYEIPYSSSYKYGVVNSAGKLIVSAKYSYIGNYHNGLAKAKDSLGWLYIDTSGREVFRASLCTEVGDFHDGLAKAKDSVGWKFYNTSGKEVFRASLCTEVGDFHDGFVKAKDSVGWKFYNTSGREVFRASLCKEVGDFHDGLVKAKDSVGWKFYNTSGKEVFRASLCTEVGDFHDGFVKAKDSVGWKFYNTSGNEKFRASLCTDAGDFYNGLVRVKDNLGWKFYNTSGKEAFRVSNADAVSDCCNGYVIVAKGSQSSSNDSGVSPKYVKPPTLPPRYDDSKFVVTNATIILNGEEQHFSVPTISYLDRTLVPMRELFEKLGTEVIWNGENQSITAITPTKEIIMAINNQFVLSRGVHLVVDVPPMLYKDRTVVPLRFVCEQLHLDVEWDGGTNTIILTSKGTISLKEEIDDYGFKARYYGEYINGSIKDGIVNVQYFTGDDIYSGTIISHDYQQYSDGQQITAINYDENGDLVCIRPIGNTGMYYGPLTIDGTTNSQTYLGNITDGRPDGYGYVEYGSGDRYYGYFKDGKKSGQGVYVWAYKSSEGAYFYNGEWANDQANGYGIYVWYDGLYHVGNFKNGFSDGYGTRYFTNGKVTKGYWEDGDLIK